MAVQSNSVEGNYAILKKISIKVIKFSVCKSFINIFLVLLEYAPWNITPVSPVFPKQPEPLVNRELQNGKVAMESVLISISRIIYYSFVNSLI